MSAADQMADDAGRTLAAAVDTRGPGGAVVLFNPFAQPISQFVEYEPWTDWHPWQSGDWGLTDAENRPVPYQLIETHEALSSPRSSLNRLVFPVELPPMGYRVYRFAPNQPQAPFGGRAGNCADAGERDSTRTL